MKKRVLISELQHLERFMYSFNEDHSEDFKAMVLHLISNSDITAVSQQTGLAESTLYDWNKKKN